MKNWFFVFVVSFDVYWGYIRFIGVEYLFKWHTDSYKLIK